MKLGAAYLVNGLGYILAVSIVSAACGSDSAKRSVRHGGGGAGGEGGDVSAAAGQGNPGPLGGQAGEPTAAAGMGGEPGIGGVGGDSAGAAGTTPLPMGGEPGVGGVGGEGGSGGSLPAIDCSTIAFDDMNLESAVRDAIGKTDGEPILPADVAALGSLNARGYGIELLNGIECIPSLTSLDLGLGGAPSNVVDLSPLAYLKGLTTFDCTYCPITSVEPLGDLPSLSKLYLSLAGNGVDAIDLSGLATAPALTEIDLRQTRLGSLSPLGQIETLTTLQVTSSTLTVPASVGDLTNLTWLAAYGAAVTDATQLGKLTKLEHLEIGSTTMTNTPALAALVNLTLLDMTNAGVTDPSFVQNMTKLNFLSFYGNPLANLNGLAANAGLAAGDTIYLTGVTTLNCTNEAANLATIKGRGPTIFGNPCP